MPNKCSVPECSGRGGFSFPSDPKQRLKWREAIKISWTPTAWSTVSVCDSHFKPDDFKDIIRAEEPAKKRRRVLKSTAVPSLFSWSWSSVESITPPTSSASPRPWPSHAPDDEDEVDSKRVHVERVIGLAKSYKILTDKMDASRTPFGGRQNNLHLLCAM